MPFIGDVDIYYPGATPLDVSDVVGGPILHDTSSSLPGFDALVTETWFDEPGPGELAVASFRRILPGSRDASAALGATPLPFVFPDSLLGVTLEAYRSNAFPVSHEDLFGPDLETRLGSLSSQPEPICVTTAETGYSVWPVGP